MQVSDETVEDFGGSIDVSQQIIIYSALSLPNHNRRFV